MKYFLIYLAAINIIGFVMMYIDKRKAMKHRWRISERALFITALIGGALGVYAGMKKFRHKTHHKQFVFGIPAVIVLHLAAAVYFLYVF